MRQYLGAPFGNATEMILPERIGAWGRLVRCPTFGKDFFRNYQKINILRSVKKGNARIFLKENIRMLIFQVSKFGESFFSDDVLR